MTADDSTHEHLTALRRSSTDKYSADQNGGRQVGIIHLGLGAFHRSHQAWYTAQCDLSGDWGIAAFTGRSPEAAERLAAQDGLYTLVTRGPDGDRHEVIPAIVEARHGGETARLAELMARESVGVVTLTITEAGYHLRDDSDGPRLDAAASEVAADLEVMASAPARSGGPAADGAGTAPVLLTAAARIVHGLAARRDAGLGGLAVVSCDNLPDNGEAARSAVLGTAEAVDAALAGWIAEHISFVSSSVDRITPRVTEEDRRLVQARTGLEDRSPVITEPFTSWVLCGEFPAGRPAWEEAGALFVDDLEPFERRKLWLLNGAHTLMACAGRLRGHTTVSEAIDDDVVAGWVDELWDEASRHLTAPGLDVRAYREALRTRFGNPRIAHRLGQIAADGTLKLRARILPVLRAEQEQDRTGTAARRAIAAWMDHMTELVRRGEEVIDPESAAIVEGVAASDSTRELLRLLDPGLVDQATSVESIRSLRGSFTR